MAAVLSLSTLADADGMEALSLDDDLFAAWAGPLRLPAYNIALDYYTKAHETSPDQAYT